MGRGIHKKEIIVMGRGIHKNKKQQMKVKSFRLHENELTAIKVFMESEHVDQSTAVRNLIHYGILYYTMQQIDASEEE